MFDDGYDKGDVVRLFFGHAPNAPEGGPFARRDVVVVGDDGDAIVGHYATVSDKTRGSLRGDEDDDPTNDVRVKSRTLTIRKAAVVMKRDFGTVGVDDDVRVTEDATGTWSTDDEGGD